MVHVCCNLCGADDPRAWLNLTDRFSKQSFQLVKCKQCGLIYLTPRPSMEELSIYYPENYEAFQPPAAEISATQAWHIGRMWEMQIAYVMRFSKMTGSLLDVGCATGEFINTARKHGWQVFGLEMIEQAAQNARERYGLEVTTGTLEAIDLPENSFDVITLWDVLEHLPDPQEALKRCSRLLRRNGIVVFSIPNLASIDRYLFGKRWIGWDAPRHFTLFTSQTLHQMLSNAGFSIVSMDCFTGGKGTFLLSLDNVLEESKLAGQMKKYYPLISALLWPYRQFSYLVRRGPILAVVAGKLEQK